MMPRWRLNKTLTIRHRLLLSFLTILALFAVNIGFFSISRVLLKRSVDSLLNAINAQKYIMEIQQKLNNLQKQVTLLSAMSDSAGGFAPREIDDFKVLRNEVTPEIDSMVSISRGDARTKTQALKETYTALSESWGKFYEDFGVNQAAANMELVLRAEPKGQEVQLKLVPDVLEAQKHNVDQATADFDSISNWTGRISIGLFLISGGIAILIAYRLSQYLTNRLGDLILGAAVIGIGRLHNRIKVEPHDELGNLAHAFNSMADNLDHARNDLTRANVELERRHEQVERQRQMSESLLLNILPEQIAHELRENEMVEPKYFEDVTILFTDFVGFTLSTETMAAEKLVSHLNDYFTAFDKITTRYGIEKMKTIGDSYMSVSGMPSRNPAHPVDMVLAAFEMLRAVEELGRREGAPGWKVRIGIHTGPVIAGVVGTKKFAFDVWGDSVNYSSRMESSGAPNRINLSARTHSRVKDFFACEHRGKVATKDKREMEMFFATGILPELMNDAPGKAMPAAFARRYHIYFQQQPPSFPAFLMEHPATSVS